VISLPSWSAASYTIEADATGAQVQDTGCTQLTIDQSGNRYPPASSSPNCWR
jgi:Tfp pilus assembly protein PilE